MSCNRRLALLGALVGLFAGEAAAQVTFYEGESYRGRVFAVQRASADLARSGHRGASAIVEGGFWEACEDADFKGRCVVLRRGSYAFMVGMGLEQPVRSVRPVAERAYYQNEAPPALTYPTYEYRRRVNEPVFQASVTSVSAVFGIGDARCSIEEGPLRDAVAPGELGAAILAYHPGDGASVPRCRGRYGDPPEYWEVAYTFRGAHHRAHTSAQPRATIDVNAHGEPRG